MSRWYVSPLSWNAVLNTWQIIRHYRFRLIDKSNKHDPLKGDAWFVFRFTPRRHWAAKQNGTWLFTKVALLQNGTNNKCYITLTPEGMYRTKGPVIRTLLFQTSKITLHFSHVLFERNYSTSQCYLAELERTLWLVRETALDLLESMPDEHKMFTRADLIGLHTYKKALFRMGCGPRLDLTCLTTIRESAVLLNCNLFFMWLQSYCLLENNSA